MTIDLTSIQDNLAAFVQYIKSLDDANFGEHQKHEAYHMYKQLYAQYSTLDTEVINANFSEDNIKLISFLQLGLANEQEFDTLLNSFNTDVLADSVGSVVNLIKSRYGFELIHSESGFEKFTDTEIVNFFGSLFGIKIADSCVKSLKAEKIGRILGYALSGNQKGVLENYKKIQKTHATLDFVSYMKEQIQKSDFECVYGYRENEGHVSISCRINESTGSTLEKVRSKNRVDHCFVNDTTKTITFGLSTANKNTDAQGDTFFRVYTALSEMVKLPVIDNEPNKYYGYKLDPYFMLGGRYAVDAPQRKQEKGRALKSMLQNVSKDDMQTMAQLQYFNLYGNSSNINQLMVLTKFNVFIAGCDTLDIFNQLNTINSSSESPVEVQMQMFSYVTNKLSDVCNILFNNYQSLSFGEQGRKDLELILTDIINVTKSLFTNFNFKLSSAEYTKYIVPLRDNMGLLVEGLSEKTGLFGNRTLNDLTSLVDDYLEDETQYNKKIIRAKVASVDVTWVDPNKFKNLTLKKIGELYGTSDLALIPEISRNINYATYYDENPKIVQEFLTAIDLKINKNFTLKDMCSNGLIRVKSDVAFRQELKKYLDKNVGPASDFIRASAFILNERYASELIHTHCLELIEVLKQKIIPRYPKIKDIINYYSDELDPGLYQFGDIDNGSMQP